MSPPSDRDLILRARRGDMDAFGELVIRYQSSVFNVCYRMTNERRQAEDLAQETFLRIHSRLTSFDLGRPFGPWIRRTAANICLNHLNSSKVVDVEWNDDLNAHESHSPEDTYEHQERDAQIRAALAYLPPQYRLAIELRHFQELSYAEIAAELGVPLSAVKSHLFRGRKMLAGMLK